MNIETKKAVIFKISKRVRHPVFVLGLNCTYTVNWCGGGTAYYGDNG